MSSSTSFYLAIEPKNLVSFSPVQVLLSFVLAVGATVLFRKVRGWPALLILIGSVGYFVMNANNAFFMYAITYHWIRLGSPVWRHWSINFLDNAAGVATVCLPIGLLAFALRATRSR
jgi:hypothetical protein